MNKLWVETFVLEFTNEIPDDTIEDDVRNIRGDIMTEKVFGFYRCEGLSGMILMM